MQGWDSGSVTTSTTTGLFMASARRSAPGISPGSRPDSHRAQVLGHAGEVRAVEPVLLLAVTRLAAVRLADPELALTQNAVVVDDGHRGDS